MDKCSTLRKMSFSSYALVRNWLAYERLPFIQALLLMQEFLEKQRSNIYKSIGTEHFSVDSKALMRSCVWEATQKQFKIGRRKSRFPLFGTIFIQISRCLALGFHASNINWKIKESSKDNPCLVLGAFTYSSSKAMFWLNCDLGVGFCVETIEN